MKRYFAIWGFAAMLAASLVACKREELATYSASPAVNFSTLTMEYSFLGNASGDYIQEIPVKISGLVSKQERHFDAFVVNDSITTAPAGMYELLGGTVPPNSLVGTFKIKLKNDSTLRKKRIAVKIQLGNTPDFVSGNVETRQAKVQWSDQIVIPAWTYYRYFFTTQASTKAYQLIVQSTGLTTFTAAQYRALTPAGAEAMGVVFGDYVKQWNKDHPNEILKHDDGTLAGQPIVPLYYSRSKFD
ncbi:uncharacterized protein DUF4843 [Chitinophaga skermanii]|uniref:Uncharacterized protein DUF4843 n=1 Tax=Chitinophaga skermanii TaxID=331697 RepID=A0A327QRE1_9BACT|nr:DUF4843 domain-containing protein [Chitinophaga skermanii]RAJ06465.1 uncharacterized protein DUF4843 [Chitinophaga skermanii]